MKSPPLGWIAPQDRTPAQHAAHALAVAAMPRFAVAGNTDPAGPVKVVLTDLWKHPDVVADVGFAFDGFHQFTGSCVGVSAGNAIFTLAAVQRLLADAPTKAFVPWWPFSYGRTRYTEGDRGPGEGAVDSVMAATLIKEGVFDAGQQGLPAFTRDDGVCLTKSLELQWSDGAAAVVTKWKDVARLHPLGAAAPVHSTAEIKAAILNGYPVLDGCDNYVGNGRIKGSGEGAYVTGKYDGRGGHSTCFLGYWDHPNDGPLLLYSNQWLTSTYPADPAGAGRCCVWLTEAETAKLFRTGGNGETFALSHLPWFPAQPKLIDYFDYI